MKHKNIIFGILVGFGAFYLFEKVGEKDCGCNKSGKNTAELLEPNPPNTSEKSEAQTCEEAVAIIMAERRKTMRVSEQGFLEMEKRELETCRKMNSKV